MGELELALRGGVPHDDIAVNGSIKGREIIRKAIELEPDNIKYLMAAAVSYYMNHMPEKSLELLDKVLVIEPKHSKAEAQRRRLLQVMNE